MKIIPLTPVFAARIDGVDITRPLRRRDVGGDPRRLRRALGARLPRPAARRRDARSPSAAASARSRSRRSMNPAAGTPFARQSNLDIKTGEVIPPDDRRMVYQLANMLWHSDSSFKPVPSLCSLLSGRIVPPEGGATEFASARAAYPSLPDDAEAPRGGPRRRARLRVVARPGPARLLHRQGARRVPAGAPPARARQPGERPPRALPRRPRLARRRACRSRRAARCCASCSTTSPSRSSATATSGGRATWSSGTTAACCTGRRRSTPRAIKRLMQRTTVSGDPREPAVR